MSHTLFSQQPSVQWDIVVIGVSGEVDNALVRHITRGFRQKQDTDRVLYVLNIDSFGGRVDAAFAAVDTIQSVTNGEVVTFIQTKAISAAALIALASDRVYMADNTTLGDCAPIIMTFDGPKEVGEKFQSPLRAKFRSLAKKNGFPELLAEAMVSKEHSVYKLTTPDTTFYADSITAVSFPDSSTDKSVVVKRGQLLTMDNIEAIDLGFSRATVSSVDELLADMGITSYTITNFGDRPGISFLSRVGGLERIYWFLAIPATFVFLIMSILTFMGLGDNEGSGDSGGADEGSFDDIDTDTEGTDGGADQGGGSFLDALHLFTFRNFVVFFMMFGWTGIAMIRSNTPVWLTILVSTLVGVFMMFVVSLMFYGISRLVHSGNVGIHSALGATGTVYLTIPAAMSGAGKVTVSVANRNIEYRAMTKGKKLKNGEAISVVEIIGNDVVLVDTL